MANVNWRILSSDTDLDEAIQRSHQNTVVLFKHSTRCSVSSMALRFFEQSWNYDDASITPYFLDLIQYRSLSNRIASEFAVDHESPQMIVVKDGMAILDRSHNMIDANALGEFA